MEAMKFDSKIKKLIALGAATSLMLTGLASAPGFADQPTAIAKIMAYAGNPGADAGMVVPETTDYDDALVSLVTSSNLAAVNAEVDLVGSGDVSDQSKIQTVVDRVVAIIKISNYEGSAPTPIVVDYVDAGITTGVNASNLAAINVLIAAATTEDSNTALEIQGIVTAANDAVTALSTYSDGTAPLLAGYTTAGITGVTSGNLAAINVLIAAATTENSNTAEKIQALIDAESLDLAAIVALSLYGDSGPVPSLSVYTNAGIENVNSGNLAAINVLIAAATTENSNTAEDIQAIVTAANAAIVALSNYSGPTPIPSEASYTTAGITGVTSGNLSAINGLIAAANASESNTGALIQGIVDSANSALTALKNYEVGDTAPILSVYEDAGITGVNAGSLVAVNGLIATASSALTDTAVKIQTIVTLVNTSVSTLSAYTGTETAPALTVYANAGITGVNANNVVAINAVIGAASATATDTAAEIQAIVALVNTTVSTLSAYAGTGTAPALTVYDTAGITGVNAGNLVAINGLIAAASSTATDSAAEIQAIVTLVNTSVSTLSAYAGTGTAPALTVYTNAGITGVNSGNLAAVNALVADASASATDTAAEIQAIVSGASAAVALIAAYAGVGTAPTAQTYTDALVTGVNAGNLAAINLLIAAATSANSDTTVEIQAIVTAQATALSTITAYAAGSTALTVAQYAAAGITGVSATNLAKINTSIAAATLAATDTAVEVQTIVNGLNAVASYWTKRISNTQAKLYAKNIVGAGKVQFFLNGKEIAWIKAVDESDVKLRAANGAYYLVRTVNLAVGKNVLEVKVAGTQVRRVVYSR